MLLWMRVLGTLGLSVLLMGSKIIIRVPEGGSVTSSSGLYACSAGETCTIDVDPGQFTETFTAQADPGFEFSGWRGGANALCPGSVSVDCDQLDTGGFSAGGLGTVSLTPGFASRAAASVESIPPVRIHSHHRTRYFDVSGANQEQVWQQLRGAANPLAGRYGDGTVLGHADFHYRYEYQPTYGSRASACRIASAELEFGFETVLPRLRTNAGTEAQLARHWPGFQAAITEHEAGHHAIYRQLVTGIPDILQSLGEVPCEELAQTVQLAVAGLVEQVRQRSRDYDAAHGSGDYLAASF